MTTATYTAATAHTQRAKTAKLHRAFLSRVMTLAWGLYRSDRGRGFADALAGAWRYLKREAKEKAPRLPRPRSIVASPIRSSLRGQRYAGARDYRAAYLTARLGA